LPYGQDDSYEFIFGTDGKLTTRVYIDPYRVRVLGVRTAGSDFFLWLQSLHFDLLAGERGRQINGAVACALILLGISGLTMWVRSSASLAARVRPLWGVRAARRNWGLHMAAGFWGAPLLLLMAVTALYFAFHEPVARLVYAVTRTAPPPPLPALQSRPATVPLDDLLRRARALEPPGRFTIVRLPRSPGQVLTFNYVLPGDLSDLGANGIHFDPNTGTALRVDRLRDMQLGPRIVAAFVPIHFGTFGRTASRILWALLGLLPTILFITGLAMWRRRRLRTAAPGVLSPERDRSESLAEVRNT
jgi:uncharacterized iron-regulated membrane protein